MEKTNEYPQRAHPRRVREPLMRQAKMNNLKVIPKGHKTSKSLLFVGVIILLSLSLVSAGYIESNPYYGLSRSTVVGSGTFDQEICAAGQDFVVQIMPFGCTPSVVRTDLLEEQNVPVFCQLAATKINPLIDVEAIESISFQGDYPEEVSGVGFHPANAALGVKGDLNNPLLNNIGYAVIVLKRQKNASAIPEFVEGTLTAKIKYDIKNAFGVGRAEFYLPELSDTDWESKQNQYSFWNGKGSLRAESVDSSGARISVYDGTRKIISVDLKKGETSGKISIPTMDECLSKLQIRLNSFENPDTRAKLNINSDIIEVGEGEKFLDGKCNVLSNGIKKEGLLKQVDIKCKGDDKVSGFSLRISPKVVLNVNGIDGEYGLGDKLPIIDQGNKDKNIFLGFIGDGGTEGKKEDLYVRFVSAPYHESKLTNEMLSEVAAYDSGGWEAQKAGGWLRQAGTFILEGSVDLVKRFANFLVAGSKISGTVKVEEGMEGVYGNDVALIGFAGNEDTTLPAAVKENYELAMQNFKTVIDNYPSEKYGSSVLAVDSFIQSINLAHRMDQKKTADDLCKQFKEKYLQNYSVSGLDRSLCSGIFISNSGIAVDEVFINGVVKRISFEDVVEPKLEDYSIDITVTNAGDNYSGSKRMRKDEAFPLSEKESITLREIKDDRVEFDVNIDEAWYKEAGWKTNEMVIMQGDFKTIGGPGYKISVNKINLKKSARVSVIPSIDNAGTDANFSFKIGIEQRAIQLSPEKTKAKINNLKKTIEDWTEKSERLGKAVTGFKAACLATGTGLMVKNFFTNLGGESIARQDVMRMKDGWNEKCKDLTTGANKEFNTLDECFIEKADEIDADVAKRFEEMENQNKQMEIFQEKCKSENTLTDIFFTEEHVDTNCLKDGFWEDSKEDLRTDLHGIFGDEITSQGQTIKIDEFVDKLDSSQVSVDDLRSMQLNARLGADKELQGVMFDVYQSTKEEVAQTDFSQQLNSNAALTGMKARAYADKDAITGIYDGGKTTATYNEIPADAPVQAIIYNNQQYLLELEDIGGNEFQIKQIYDSAGAKTTNNEILKRFKSLKQYDKNTYKNSYQNPELSYYETEPYAGFPALVPVDKDNGWYASVKQTLPIGKDIKSYDASGAVSSFYLCNVGKNGNEEGRGGDDICQMINIGTGQPYGVFHGLDQGDATKYTKCAVDAIASASRLDTSSRSGTVTINAGACGTVKVNVGSPALDIPAIQCQDFMSPKDCNLLFNVCDPVICPSSRCDFGGTYPVKDVIQTGIVGGIFLCLPNAKENIYVPICLSGIKSGVDGYLSILTAHRDCLQESLDSGEVVGICDEIYSVYACEFFWRQALPLTKLIIPKIMEFALGQNVRGGGEYLGVQAAWDNAGKSVDFFTQSYGLNAFKAFQARSIEQTGSDLVCKNSISGVFPSDGDLISSLTEPDSPPQFHGRFDATEFTDVTVPPQSHYKVFYHIYAGKDSRAAYQVYLTREGDESFYQSVSNKHVVASGYIPTGEYASETADFTAPSGYQKLCINVNGQEECNFNEVSTSFAVNYVKEKYLEEQALKDDIKTEGGCISGSSSAYSLINPSLQGAAEDLVDPAIYNRGIIRICATENPGKGTDDNAELNGSRWVDVGYCNDRNIKCWLDTQSVKDVIKNTEIEGNVLETQNENHLDNLIQKGIYEDEETIRQKIDELEEKDADEKLKLIEEIFEKTYMNYQKAKLIFEKALAYVSLIEKDKINAVEIEGTSTGAIDAGYYDSSVNPTICDECGMEHGVCTQEICEGISDDCEYGEISSSDFASGKKGICKKKESAATGGEEVIFGEGIDTRKIDSAYYTDLFADANEVEVVDGCSFYKARWENSNAERGETVGMFMYARGEKCAEKTIIFEIYRNQWYGDDSVAMAFAEFNAGNIGGAEDNYLSYVEWATDSDDAAGDYYFTAKIEEQKEIKSNDMNLLGLWEGDTGAPGCDLNSVEWIDCNVMKGNEAKLRVRAIGSKCEGNELAIKVYREPAIGSDELMNWEGKDAKYFKFTGANSDDGAIYSFETTWTTPSDMTGSFYITATNDYETISSPDNKQLVVSYPNLVNVDWCDKSDVIEQIQETEITHSCTLVGAGWEESEAKIGEAVTMRVYGKGDNCLGKEIILEPYKSINWWPDKYVGPKDLIYGELNQENAFEIEGAYGLEFGWVVADEGEGDYYFLARIGEQKTESDMMNVEGVWNEAVEIGSCENCFGGVSVPDSGTGVCSIYDEGECVEWAAPGLSDYGKLLVLMGNTFVGGKQFCNCDEYCGDYAEWILKYSEERGVDPLLSLAIMMQESKCEFSASSAASSYGLMQINEPTFEDKCEGKLSSSDGSFEDVKFEFDYRESNVECGIKILESKYSEFKNNVENSWSYNNVGSFKATVDLCSLEDKYPQYKIYTSWDAALRGYNGWGCGQNADTDYVEDVNAVYGELISMWENF